MQRIFKGHTIEFDSLANLRTIVIDGNAFSMDNTTAKHGYSWRTSANGIIYCYSSADNVKIDGGLIFEIPRKQMLEWCKED